MPHLCSLKGINFSCYYSKCRHKARPSPTKAEFPRCNSRSISSSIRPTTAASATCSAPRSSTTHCWRRWVKDPSAWCVVHAAKALVKTWLSSSSCVSLCLCVCVSVYLCVCAHSVLDPVCSAYVPSMHVFEYLYLYSRSLTSSLTYNIHTQYSHSLSHTLSHTHTRHT